MGCHNVRRPRGTRATHNDGGPILPKFIKNQRQIDVNSNLELSSEEVCSVVVFWIIFELILGVTLRLLRINSVRDFPWKGVILN